MLQSKHGAGSRHPLTAGIDQAVGVVGMGVQVLPAAASHGSCVAWCCCHERCSAPPWPWCHLHRFPSTSYAHPRGPGAPRSSRTSSATPALRPAPAQMLQCLEERWERPLLPHWVEPYLCAFSRTGERRGRLENSHSSIQYKPTRVD